MRRMYEWARDWQMLFYIDKCSVIHMGICDKEFKYDIRGVTLRASEEERDHYLAHRCETIKAVHGSDKEGEYWE